MRFQMNLAHSLLHLWLLSTIFEAIHYLHEFIEYSRTNVHMPLTVNSDINRATRDNIKFECTLMLY